MIVKEWQDARWRLVIGALAILAVVAIVPKTYGGVLADVEQQTRQIERGLQRPLGEPSSWETLADLKRSRELMREHLEQMREPGYPAKAAGWDLQEIQRLGNYAVLVPLAGLLGVALVSAEVGQGSIFLLLSRPVSRRRTLLTKYAVCAAGLLAVALVGAVGIILSAFAHGYPSEAIPMLRILGSAALTWLGSLFVLGVSLLASVIFRSVLSTVLAAAATVYLVHAGPDLVRSAIEGFFWTNKDSMRPLREMIAWQEAFDTWRLSYYWGGFDPFSHHASASQSFLVCLITAVPPLLLALWLFRRRAY